MSTEDEPEDEWVDTDRDAPRDADEWDACTAPNYLVGPLWDLAPPAGPGVRRWLRFGAACGRLVWDLLPDPDARAAVEAAEGFADGRLPEGELRAALGRAADAARRRYDPGRTDWEHPPESYAAFAAARLWPDPDAYYGQPGHSGSAHDLAIFALAHAAPGGNDPWSGAYPAARVRASRRVADLVRCVFGNPYRPVVSDPQWRTADAVGLARGIDAERAFDRLPLLADALMDAGCADAAVLAHCRGGGPHARGCWVVDLVLGNE